MSVVIETTIGDVTIDLFVEERPITCKNFINLCKMKYYNYCTFHFIQRDFIAQTGDPTGTGTGGESVYARIFGDKGRFIESEKKPKIKHDRLGLVSMVNNGDNLHGSQFFFTLCHSLDYLDGVHTVFGHIVEGEDVLVKLNDTICDEKNHPYQDIMITHTVILDDPFPPIEGLEIPDSSPTYQLEDLLKSDRIGIGENIFNDDKPIEEIEEEIKDKDAKQRALLLEMIGDIPDADIAPPENVLFVCKLNPVTREEDLEIIFSRFGQIVSCEIIKDEKTGDSLQYGFIEFSKKEDCEQAYFKMDNVLIDDRRIHVDFSQSVSRIKWRGKGRGVTYNANSEDEVHSRSKDFQRKTMNYIKTVEKSRHRLKYSVDDDRRRASPTSHKQRKSSPNPRRDRHHSDRSKHRNNHRSNSRENRHRSRTPERYRKRRSRSRDDTNHRHNKSSKHEREDYPRHKSSNENHRHNRHNR